MFEAVFLQSTFNIDISAKYNSSDLAIAIGAPANNRSSPNITTDLDFDSTASLGAEVNFGYMHSLGKSHTVFGEIGGTFGKLTSGTLQNSSYAGNDRTGVSSRAISELEHDNVHDLHYKLGVKSRWFGKPGHYNTVYVGQSAIQQNNHFKKNTVLLPPEDAGKTYPNLNSTYKVETLSRNIGVTTEHETRIGVISAGYEHGNIDYDGTANWNLRTELKHPKSFVQSAEGTSDTVSLTYTLPVSKSVDLSISYQQTNYKMDKGYDSLNLASGTTQVSKLKNVEFNSYSVKTGVSFRF